MKAIDLDKHALGQMVGVIDYAGRAVTGRLDAFQLWNEPRTRVVMKIATEEPRNESDGGGTYWSTWGNDVYVNRDEEVTILS